MHASSKEVTTILYYNGGIFVLQVQDISHQVHDDDQWKASIAFYIKTKHKHQKQLKINSNIEKAVVALVTNDANNAVTSTYFNVYSYISQWSCYSYIFQCFNERRNYS